MLGSGTRARADAYTLRAELDVERHVVHGSEEIVFTNASGATLDHLVFHLYMNAFESDATVFRRESGGQLRGVRAARRGGIRVVSMRTGGRDLLRGAERELVAGDRTQLRVQLPSPVPPGGTITIDARFETTLPKVFARAGYVNDFHMVAQWFPKLAKLERDGHFESFPYHGHGEFYADFASYELTVVTTRDITVGASGVLVDARPLEGDRIARTYVADRVHDVAFVASRYLSLLDTTCARVNVHVLAPPGYDDARDAHLHITCRALAFLGETYGAYPYTDLTVVVPPRGAAGASGMEYPTLFVTAGLWFDADALGLDEATETTVHELVHQWFQGIVATNEVRHPFLDEGITSFVTSDYHVSYAPRAADMRTEALRRFSAPRGAPPPGSYVTAFDEGNYGAVVYLRSEMILETVARTWGRARVRRALGLYARENRFRHPGPSALFSAFDRVYWPGFSSAVLEPLFMKGERLTFRAGVQGRGLVATRRGLRAIPLDVLHEAPNGARTLARFGDRDSLRFGEGCVTIDPFRKVLLDRRRGDDRVCTPAHREGTTYPARLAALLSAFLVGVP